MVNEKDIFDGNDKLAMVIKFEDDGKLIGVDVYSTAMNDFLPVDLNSEEPEVKRTKMYAQTKINQHFEIQERIKDVKYLEAY